MWGFIQEDLICTCRALWEFIIPFNLCMLIYECLDTDDFWCSKLLVFFFPFIFNSSYRVSSPPKSVPVGNVNVYGHKYLVFFLLLDWTCIFLWMSPCFISSYFTHETVFLKVFPENVNFFLCFGRSFIQLAVKELCANFTSNSCCICFSVWNFPAIWFHSLMKFVGKDVPPLSLFKHLAQRKSLWEVYVSLWALSYVLPLQL